MRLTSKQEHVLRVLDGASDIQTTQWGAWYPITVEQARGILNRLYDRGLVRPTRFLGNTRCWEITGLGRDVLRHRDRREEERCPEE
jgi:hypothetical protein